MAWRLDGSSLGARHTGAAARYARSAAAATARRRRRIAQDVGIEKKEGRKALKQWIFLSIVMLF